MNEQVRVVVVDDSEAVLGSVKQYFRGSEDILITAVFTKGKEALDYLINNQSKYDLLVIDLLLPETDGIKILEELKNKKINKQIIVLSSFKDDYSIKKSQQLGANYYMLKPISMEILDKRILDLQKQKDEVKLAQKGALEIEISTLLHDLGIPSNVRGYKYIREAILLLYAHNHLTSLITKDIYPEIAKKYETTPSRVERAIRHAIELSWTRGDIALMEDLFGNSIDIERSRPTNAEFLTTLADRFKLNRKEILV